MPSRIRSSPLTVPITGKSDFARWFESRGWSPRAHQLELLAKAQAGRSVLLIAPTGGGKTLAGFLPSLVELSGQKAKLTWVDTSGTQRTTTITLASGPPQ